MNRILFLVLIAATMGLQSCQYNTMIEKQEAVTAQWAQVENVYQRRADLIPNLVSTVKGYADFEQETLTAVIEARAKATGITVDPSKLDANSIQQFQAAQDGLSSALSKLMVVVEKYPDLKANQNFLELQAQLEGTENRISVERKKFNEVAQDYNTYIRKFPNNLIAGMFDFEKKEYFEADAGAEKAPKVEF
jgi:LemA protein